MINEPSTAGSQVDCAPWPEDALHVSNYSAPVVYVLYDFTAYYNIEAFRSEMRQQLLNRKFDVDKFAFLNVYAYIFRGWEEAENEGTNASVDIEASDFEHSFPLEMCPRSC